jgi:hypothetical protein
LNSIVRGVTAFGVIPVGGDRDLFDRMSPPGVKLALPGERATVDGRDPGARDLIEDDAAAAVGRVERVGPAERRRRGWLAPSIGSPSLATQAVSVTPVRVTITGAQNVVEFSAARACASMCQHRPPVQPGQFGAGHARRCRTR